MQERLKVILNDDYSEQLKQQVFAVISEAVQQAKKNATQAPEWLKGKSGVSEYLNVDTSIVDKMIALGLTGHHIESSKLTFFKKSEVDNFLLNDGFIK